jgi:hypothetical protein
MNSEFCAPPRSDGSGITPGSGSEVAQQKKIAKKFWKIMKTRNFELIELPIQANQPAGRVMFPDIPQLRGTTLQAVEGYVVSHIGFSPTGLTVMSMASATNSYIGLFVNGKDQIVRMPYPQLIRLVTPTIAAPYSNELQQFDNLLGVDWSKSFIQFSAAPQVGIFAVMLGVHYL